MQDKKRGDCLEYYVEVGVVTRGTYVVFCKYVSCRVESFFDWFGQKIFQVVVFLRQSPGTAGPAREQKEHPIKMPRTRIILDGLSVPSVCLLVFHGRQKQKQNLFLQQFTQSKKTAARQKSWTCDLSRSHLLFLFSHSRKSRTIRSRLLTQPLNCAMPVAGFFFFTATQNPTDQRGATEKEVTSLERDH